MKMKWILIAVCIVSIATASFGFGQPVQAEANPPADQSGPYKVGYVMNIYHDSTRSDYLGGARPVVTSIWYPAAPDNHGNPMAPAVYVADPFGFTGELSYPSTAFEAHGVDPAYREVAASANGPFPLVIFSVGQSGLSMQYNHIGARLASHGFVVAVVANYGDGAMGEPYWMVYTTGEAYNLGSYIERTRDIPYVITRLVADSNDPANLLYGAIREDQIAVSGHSIGALAALALSGGDDLACDWPLGLWVPNNIPPETCIPILPDARIKAIVPIDGTSYALHFAELARIEIPSMIIGQEWDNLERQAPGFGLGALLARPHSAIRGHPNYRVDISNYTHQSFTSLCSYLLVWHDYGFLDDATLDLYVQAICPQAPAPPDEIGNLITKYMIAFLKTALAGEPGYQAMLTPGYAQANEPYIEFFVTEKRNPNALEDDFPGYFTYFMHQPGSEQARALKDPSGVPAILDTPFIH